VRLTDQLDLKFAGTFSWSKYLQFQDGNINYAGATLPNLPKYNVRVAPEYHIPAFGGDFFIAPEVVFVGKARVAPSINPYGLDIQQAYTDLNGQFGYRQGRFSIMAWVKNGLDERHILRADFNTAFGLANFDYNAPMSYGITVSGHF
jgi:iron complex outermembrane receptor protein